jgi:hypothetical protein
MGVHVIILCVGFPYSIHVNGIRIYQLMPAP